MVQFHTNQFSWQFTYRQKDPVYLPKGTRVEVLGKFDNSANKAGNPISDCSRFRRRSERMT